MGSDLGGAITLSRPTGPSEVFTMFAMAVTAVTFCVRTSCPDCLSPAICKRCPPWRVAITRSWTAAANSGLQLCKTMLQQRAGTRAVCAALCYKQHFCNLRARPQPRH
jgi:hypothetical protein